LNSVRQMGSASYKCCAKDKHELMFEKIVDFNSMMEFLLEEIERVRIYLKSVDDTNFKIQNSDEINTNNLAANDNTDYQKFIYYSSLKLVLIQFLGILEHEDKLKTMSPDNMRGRPKPILKKTNENLSNTTNTVNTDNTPNHSKRIQYKKQISKEFNYVNETEAKNLKLDFKCCLQLLKNIFKTEDTFDEENLVLNGSDLKKKMYVPNVM